MMKDNNNYKWHENITIGVLFLIISLMFFINGFSYLTSLFIKKGEVEGAPTKAKGVVAFVSMLENSWWKYILILLTLWLAFDFIKLGVRKFKNNDR